MEATSLSSNIPKLALIGWFSTKPSSHNRNRLMTIRRKLVVSAEQGRNEGKSVDENFIVLRMRIKKMKPTEASKNQDQTRLPSSDRDERETKLSIQYHIGDDVFEAMELLQSYLLKTRPGVALGVLVLVAMSLPISQPGLMAIVLKVARGLLAGCHVCIDIDF